MPLLGAHCSAAGGVWRSIERGQEIGCEAIQLFTKSNRQWKARPFKTEEVEQFRALHAESGLPVVAHGSYLINLASSDDAIWQKSLDAFLIEMDRCRTLGVPYLVLHPGAHTGSGVEAGVAQLAKAINQAHDRGDDRAMLLLEITAGTGTTLGAEIDHFVEVLARLQAPERIGFCFDSCHAIGAGWDLISEDGYAAVMAEWDARIGLDKVRCWHLNDSQFPLGAHRDRHTHIGLGECGLSTFRNILNDPRFADLPMLLETPKDEDQAQDVVNLRVLRGLYADAEPPVSEADLDGMWEGVERTAGKDG
ncbi:MAG: deoxyribonuclease IV [Ardenticatenales bacterium]|nr:deoxyribonuclease IV [Ardenticatenales bacterium]